MKKDSKAELSPAKKAWETRRYNAAMDAYMQVRSAAANKAWATRRKRRAAALKAWETRRANLKLSKGS